MNNALDLVAYEEAPIGIVLTEERIIKSCNETFATLFGYERSELLGQSFRMLYSTRKEFESFRDIGIKPLQEKGIYSDERLMRRRDGTPFWCRFRAHTLNRDNPLSRTVLSFALISETVPSVHLTQRERQIVMQLSRGLSSKEIGRELSLSPRTIEDVRSRLLKKFQAKNVTELLAHMTGFEF
ncbi:MAG: PAS and helix-turn-helix domain-containing protein [Hyphomicrobiales bacterium]